MRFTKVFFSSCVANEKKAVNRTVGSNIQPATSPQQLVSRCLDEAAFTKENKRVLEVRNFIICF